MATAACWACGRRALAILAVATCVPWWGVRPFPTVRPEADSANTGVLTLGTLLPLAADAAGAVPWFTADDVFKVF